MTLPTVQAPDAARRVRRAKGSGRLQDRQVEADHVRGAEAEVPPAVANDLPQDDRSPMRRKARQGGLVCVGLRRRSLVEGAHPDDTPPPAHPPRRISTSTTSSDDLYASDRGRAAFPGLMGRIFRDAASGFRRIILPKLFGKSKWAPLRGPMSRKNGARGTLIVTLRYQKHANQTRPAIFQTVSPRNHVNKVVPGVALLSEEGLMGLRTPEGDSLRSGDPRFQDGGGDRVAALAPALGPIERQIRLPEEVPGAVADVAA